MESSKALFIHPAGEALLTNPSHHAVDLRPTSSLHNHPHAPGELTQTTTSDRSSMTQSVVPVPYRVLLKINHARPSKARFTDYYSSYPR